MKAVSAHFLRLKKPCEEFSMNPEKQKKEGGQFNDRLYYPNDDAKKEQEIRESNEFGRKELKTIKVPREPADHGWEGIKDLGKEKETKQP
jgi:hypothetical protein